MTKTETEKKGHHLTLQKAYIAFSVAIVSAIMFSLNRMRRDVGGLPPQMTDDFLGETLRYITRLTEATLILTFAATCNKATTMPR